jgi:sorbitol-6-phosphate 2-dehydrogenase
MKKEKLAVLIRGFCVNLSNKPQTVIFESAAEENIPATAMKVETGDEEDEASAALIIQKSYEAWKKSDASRGQIDNRIILPSCIALCANRKPKTLYWIGSDIDSAHKRFSKKDSTPEILPFLKEGITLDPSERALAVKNKIALVTGGAQGIGEEIVRNLAASGALVFIADLNLEGAQKLADTINAKEGRTAAIAIKVNVCDEASVEALFKSVAETSGGLDLCVSNAGVLKAGSVLEQPLEDFKFVTDINYSGFFIICKHAGRLLRTQHLTAPDWKTDIVQINSKSGLEGSNKNGAYSGGKFGGLGLVASFALELVEYNIKVNAICPGNFLDGPLWSDPEKGLFAQYLKTGKVQGAKTAADVRAFYESRVPMKRGCTGKDLVRALLYIVEQEYETGQAVPVTGGQVMLH